MQPLILITVPHRCVIFRWIDQGCDKRTSWIGRTIAAVIPRTKLFVNSTPRFMCDLNRVTCRDVLMRTRLRSALQQDASLLLDVHSFPRGAFSKSPTLDMGLMFQLGGNWLATSLVTFLRRCTSLKCQIFTPPISHNDILEEARSLGVPALLLEFADDLPDRQIRDAAKCVAQWIVEIAPRLRTGTGTGT